MANTSSSGNAKVKQLASNNQLVSWPDPLLTSSPPHLPQAPAAPGVKKPPIVSTSWSFTDNEPDTK